VQVIDPFGVETRAALRREGGLRRRVIDDDGAGGEAGPERRDDLLDHGIVREHQMDPPDAAHGLRRRGGHADAEPLQRPRPRCRAVPDDDRVAPLRGRFDEGAAEEAGAEECDFGHVSVFLPAPPRPLPPSGSVRYD
jgi:hypothetical protein